MTQKLVDYQEFPAHFPTDTTHLVRNVLDTITGPHHAPVTLPYHVAFVFAGLAVLGTIVVYYEVIHPFATVALLWWRKFDRVKTATIEAAHPSEDTP